MEPKPEQRGRNDEGLTATKSKAILPLLSEDNK